MSTEGPEQRVKHVNNVNNLLESCQQHYDVKIADFTQPCEERQVRWISKNFSVCITVICKFWKMSIFLSCHIPSFSLLSQLWAQVNQNQSNRLVLQIRPFLAGKAHSVELKINQTCHTLPENVITDVTMPLRLFL